MADVDALAGPATPHFAYQLRARIRELVSDLPAGHPVREHGERQMELLDRLGHASSKAAEVTFVSNRTSWRRSNRSATCSRYRRISGWPA